MKKIKTIILASIIALAGVFVASAPVSACDPQTDAQCMKICDMPGIDDEQRAAAGCTVDKDAKVTNNVVNIINAAISVVGIIAVIVIVLGGVRFVTSNGDAKNITTAKSAILYACVALVVSILAYAIVNFVASSIGK